MKNSFSSYWNSHKQTLELKIQQLTNEIHQLKKDNKTNVFKSTRIFPIDLFILFLK